MKTGFVVALLAIAMLCASAMAQEDTANDWLKKGYELMANGSYEEAAKAIQKSIDLSPSPTNATLWDAKAQSLALAAGLLGNRSEYNESLKAEDKAIELDPKNSTFLVNKGFLIANMADVFGYQNESMYEDAVKEFDKAIQLDPRNKDAWNWKGMVLDSRLKRYDEALAAYNKAIEIGGTDVGDNFLLSNAWKGKGYDLAMLGRYNESAAAFDKAIELSKGDITITQAYEAQAYQDKGSALFELGKYDEAVSAYDKAIELFPSEQMTGSSWYKKCVALKAQGKQSEADAAFAKAKELGYNVQKESGAEPSSTPKMLAITKIMATGEDEFVVVANSRAAAQSLNGWTLNVSDGRNGSSNQSITLPDFTIDSDERINIHLGKGESNETDVFLNSAITLNDTAGNVTLKDDTGMIVASFEYRVEADGSVTGIMTAEGEFSYPSDQNEVKMVVREAGSGPCVTERTEYEPESAYNWVDKGNALAEQGNYDEAIKGL